MNVQNRIAVTVSPRVRKAIELCAALDGSTPASYAAAVLASAIFQDIERSVTLRELWVQMEREAVENGSWDGQTFSPLARLQAESTPKRSEVTMKSWFLAGSHPHLYEQGVDPDVVYEGSKSAYLKARQADAEGSGTLMQKFKADAYRGKRLRCSAYIRAEEVENWAGLWMRIDGPEDRMLGFDNMQARPIKGTTEWQEYQIVLDVPQESIGIAFGILLAGSGQVWVSHLQFSEVTPDVATTSPEETAKEQPDNLDFAV